MPHHVRLAHTPLAATTPPAATSECMCGESVAASTCRSVYAHAGIARPAQHTQHPLAAPLLPLLSADARLAPPHSTLHHSLLASALCALRGGAVGSWLPTTASASSAHLASTALAAATSRAAPARLVRPAQWLPPALGTVLTPLLTQLRMRSLTHQRLRGPLSVSRCPLMPALTRRLAARPHVSLTSCVSTGRTGRLSLTHRLTAAS